MDVTYSFYPETKLDDPFITLGLIRDHSMADTDLMEAIISEGKVDVGVPYKDFSHDTQLTAKATRDLVRTTFEDPRSEFDDMNCDLAWSQIRSMGDDIQDAGGFDRAAELRDKLLPLLDRYMEDYCMGAIQGRSIGDYIQATIEVIGNEVDTDNAHTLAILITKDMEDLGNWWDKFVRPPTLTIFPTDKEKDGKENDENKRVLARLRERARSKKAKYLAKVDPIRVSTEMDMVEDDPDYEFRGDFF